MKIGLISSIFLANANALIPHPLGAYLNLTSYPTSVGHAVSDLDQTLKFYHDILGLIVLHQDEESVDNPAYGQLTNTSGATYKTAVVAIPNQLWTLNLVEYIGLPREQIKQREQDPGDPGLTLTVKNSSAINNALRAANMTTILDEPVPEGGAEGTTSTVWVYDPDGYDSLGFVGTIFNMSADTQWAAVTGNCDPDTRCEYYEYDAPDRVSIIYPAQYPGVGITSYNVKDLDGIVEKVRAAGLAIITQGDTPLMVDGRRSIVVRDPSGYLVRLDEEL
ncbi:hypothetical protein Daus18300_004016 [Diaporthe australafricana]|uniref:VOC domain-containing protein n=1 Tax=Diaporthe australafricana TaxID=127596 RepID=A0ABR3XB66_9PEZI